MSLSKRASLLGQLEQELDAGVLAFVTGDRPGLQTQIAAEQLPFFPRHVATLKQRSKIALLLYTRGGDSNMAWPLIGFLRSYCDDLTVVVPFYSHSCGTLLALGADHIVMNPFATLSPIDPTVANAFNPPDPSNPSLRMSISVEDVLAFLELAKNDGAEAAAAFQQLAQQVHPLALGNVQRSINQIRQLARKLLDLHCSPMSEDERDTIVARLTSELYSHQHLIIRQEAKEIGLPVEDASPPVEAMLTDYYQELCTDLQLLEKCDPPALLRAAQAVAPVGVPPSPAPSGPIQSNPAPPTSVPGGLAGLVPATATPLPAGASTFKLGVRVERGYIETSKTCDAFVTEGEVYCQPTNVAVTLGPGVTVPQVAPQVTYEVHSERWERLA